MRGRRIVRSGDVSFGGATPSGSKVRFVNDGER